MLKGKTEIKFKEWLLKTYPNQFTLPELNNEFEDSLFQAPHLTCQLALIVEFFDEQGVDIEIRLQQIIPDVKLYRAIIDNNVYDDMEYKVSRTKALTSAIEKANQILEERL